MKHGSLFSGIGGFDLSAEWMGWENVFHCEWNEFGQRVLKYYWPNAISYGDITKTDFTIHRGKIDILTGGFPCQPYSMAGKRKGKEDERHLWPEMLRTIREIQPSWVVGENVPGIINWSGGLVFHEVQTDLEAEGYEVFPVVLPACGVNAPHKRERVWFIAHNNSIRQTNGYAEPITVKQGHYNRSHSKDEFTDTKSGRLEGFRKFRDVKRTKREIGAVCINERNSINIITNTNNRRQSRKEHRQTKSGQFTEKSSTNNWQDFPTQSPLCSRDDGFSSRLDGITFHKFRNESIKAYGNAIVPQVAYQIFKAIEQYEDNVSTNF